MIPSVVVLLIFVLQSGILATVNGFVPATTFRPCYPAIKRSSSRIQLLMNLQVWEKGIVQTNVNDGTGLCVLEIDVPEVVVSKYITPGQCK